MLNAFAVIHTWPDLKNAEFEVLQRLLAAARSVEARAVVIDRNATILWSDPALFLESGTTLDPDAIDFVIALHFESGRVIDAYSYYALWQPIEFYHVFGYQKSIDKVTSYHDLLSCESDLAEAHGMNLLSSLGRAPLLPLPKMFHTLPEPYLQPNISDQSRLFYIGINWERIGRPKGRFHDTLVSLDAKKLTDIYGPELIMGVAPWAGFVTYRGELPFDGHAVKNAISRAGICLVLSSQAHKHAGIMSNRLFEGLGGGAAIIATQHPIIDKYFRNVVYLVDDSRGEQVLGQEIQERLQEIRSNPEEATRRTLHGQQILRERCSLEKSIADLFVHHHARLAHFKSQFLADVQVSVVMTFFGQSLQAFSRHLLQYVRQDRARIKLHVVCDSRFERSHKPSMIELIRGGLTQIVLQPMLLKAEAEIFEGPQPVRGRTGPTVAQVLAKIDTPFFSFASADDEVFSDHFASIAKAFEREPAAMSACAGMIVSKVTADRKETREIDSIRFTEFDSIVLVNGSGQAGRFVFRSELLDGTYEFLMQMLDGEEDRYFRLAAYLAGPLAQTSYCSYIRREGTPEPIREPVEPIEYQRQYIRDHFARDPRWLKELNKGVKIPEFVNAYSSGSPIKWQSYNSPLQVDHIMPLGEPLATQTDGRGLIYLREGFSNPEAGGIWVEAERCVIEFALPLAEPNRLSSYAIVLKLEGRRSLQTGREQGVTVAINGMVVAYQNVPADGIDVKVRIPTHFLQGTRMFRIELTPDHSEEVHDPMGNIIDPRRLSVLLRSLTLFEELKEEPVQLRAGQVYGCKRDGGVERALVNGFYASERDLTWIAGRAANLIFSIDRVPIQPVLELTAIGRRSLQTGRLPVLSVTMNGKELGSHEVTEEDTALSLDLSSMDLTGLRVDLRLSVSHAEAVFDADHTVTDNRLIGVALKAIGVVDRDGVSGGEVGRQSPRRFLHRLRRAYS